MSKIIIDEQRAREIEELAAQMKEKTYELSPPWSEDEYALISAIWRIWRANPGTNGKKIALDEIRKFYRQSAVDEKEEVIELLRQSYKLAKCGVNHNYPDPENKSKHSLEAYALLQRIESAIYKHHQ